MALMTNLLLDKSKTYTCEDGLTWTWGKFTCSWVGCTVTDEVKAGVTHELMQSWLNKGRVWLAKEYEVIAVDNCTIRVSGDGYMISVCTDLKYDDPIRSKLAGLSSEPVTLMFKREVVK